MKRSRRRKWGRPSRLAIFHDAWTDVISHPVRAALSSLGTVLGVAVLLATIGTTESASAHIVGIVDDLSARQVQVLNPQIDLSPTGIPQTFGFDGAAQARRIEGVEQAATFTRMAEVTVRPTGPARATAPADATVVAASSEVFAVIGAEVEGRSFDDGRDPVLPMAVVGRSLARDLGLPVLERHPTVQIGGRTVQVVGILTDVATHPDLLRSVLISEALARQALDLARPASVLVSVQANAAQVVADQLPVALVPSAPATLDVVRPPEPTFLRDGITSQTQGLLLALAGLCLLLGAVSIANTTLVSVLERRSEIGLRRSLGARRSDVVLHFLTESALTGALGAVVGGAVGVVATVVVAEVQGWRPVVDVAWLAAAPIVGLVIGILAGLYPAIRSGLMEPVEALRSAA